MQHGKHIDCVLIGYNELPFARYEALLRRYGEDSEAYRDLRMSCVEIDGRPMTYMDLLGHLVGPAGAQASIPPYRSGDMPNLAAAYLASFLERRGHSTHIINLFQSEQETLVRLLQASVGCVAITTTFYVIDQPVVEMVRFIHAVAPRVPIIVGGPLVLNHRERYGDERFPASLEDIGADIYIDDSQGEATLARVVAALRGGTGLGSVPNLVFSDRGRWVSNPGPPESNDLDANDIDWRRLAQGRELGTVLQARTARSCAFHCAFCAYPGRAGRLTLAGLDAVKRELDAARSVGATSMVFIDDTFNVPIKRFKELCQMLIREGYGFDWYSYFRCSNADEEAVALAAEAGCKGVFLGIESGSPALLKAMEKSSSIEKYEQGIGWLKHYGILTFASFIVGFPGETEESVHETEAFLRRTRPDFWRAQLWYSEPGTPIQRHRARHGIEGNGFLWRHSTMDSGTAMDLIEDLFLSLGDQGWLPQWSFDFWALPYLLARGFSVEDLRGFVFAANRLLARQLEYGAGQADDPVANACIADLKSLAADWVRDGKLV